MDVMERLGELALASRLKRLSERLFKDVSQVYRGLDVEFEARWFPLLYALRERSPQTVTGLARALRLTHPAINQLASQMQAKGLLRAARDSVDERRRLLHLTAKGRQTASRLEPVWREIREANRELVEQLRADGHDLLGCLADLERLLTEKTMQERVTGRLRARRARSPSASAPRERLEVLPYRPAWRRHFESLNREWLEANFSVEPADAAILADPYGLIVKPGGAVLFARQDGRIVGTCALIRHREGLFELAKMAVTESSRGQGIGRRLAEATLEEARARGASTLFLETGTRMVALRRWYQRLGFRPISKHPLGDSKYQRRSCSMQLDLKPKVAASAKGAES